VEQKYSESRNWFLTLATVFANVYLVAFAIDGGLSLVDDILRTTGASPLEGLRYLVSSFVDVATLAMLIFIAFVPHLPKVVFVPPVLFVLWLAFGAPPFDDTLQSTSIALDIIQIAVIAAVLLVSKLRSGGWLMNAQVLPHKTHLVLRTVVSFVVLGFVLPVVGFAILMVAFGSTIEKQTGGYLDFTSSGIEVRETILTREHKTVRLVGMVHVGESDFYDTLYASFPPSALVLAEGVTDRDGLAGSFSYEGFAEVLGLKVQPALGATAGDDGGQTKVLTPARPKPRPSSGAREPISIAATATRPRIIYADADVSDFAPATVTFLGKVGQIYGSQSFGELMTRLNTVGEEFTEKDLEGVFEDILTKRNARVLAEFDKRVRDYDSIIIPWGAQHMPGLEAALVQRGFRIQSQRMLPVARYQTIVDRLLGAINRPQSKTSFSYRQRKWIG